MKLPGRVAWIRAAILGVAVAAGCCLAPLALAVAGVGGASLLAWLAARLC